MKPDFVDLPQDGRSKYPEILEGIRLGTTQENADQWVKIQDFDRAPSARDASSRLKGENPEFEFKSRVHDEGEGASVYARYRPPPNTKTVRGQKAARRRGTG